MKEYQKEILRRDKQNEAMR